MKAIIAHGPSAIVAAAREYGLLSDADRMKMTTCNMTPEEIAERDRSVSRQERRALARKAAKDHPHD
jgi:hypothetical protein